MIVCLLCEDKIFAKGNNKWETANQRESQRIAFR